VATLLSLLLLVDRAEALRPYAAPQLHRPAPPLRAAVQSARKAPLAGGSGIRLCAEELPLPTAPPISPTPLPLPRFSWRTVFFFVANPLVMLPIAALVTWAAPGLGFAMWLGNAWAVSAEATRVGALVAGPMLALSLIADEFVPALKEVTQASRVITLYAFGAKLLPIRATLGAMLISTSAAVAEEIAFRGTLQTWLAALGAWVSLAPPVAAALAVLGQALVFGKLHSYTDSPVYAIAASVAGIIFGAAFALTGNLWVPIVTHFVVDLVGFVVCHVQVARAGVDEQNELLATDVPIANALRLTLGPRPQASSAGGDAP